MGVARLCTYNLHVTSIVVLTFNTGHSFHWVPGDIISYPSMTFRLMDAYKGEHISHILVHEFRHRTKKGGMSVIRMSCFQARVGFINQRCIAKDQKFVTIEWDTRSPSFR